MRYRRLGDSGLLVSEIALGSWLTYPGGVDAATSRACIRKALDLGINLIDTANVYGRGAAETFLGETLAEVPRDRYMLATKLYFPMSDRDRGLSRAQIQKQLDASLTRLKTDYVDLYRCHRFDAETPLEETMQALTEAVTPRGSRYAGPSPLRFKPAPIFPSLAETRGGDYSALRRRRDFANRLVAACPRHAHRQV